MRAVLGPFVIACVEARFDADLSACLDEAIAHYRSQPRSGSALPRPSGVIDDPGGRGAVETEVAIKPADAAFVDTEAGRLGIVPAELLSHVLLLYLADQDRRAARRACDGRKHRRAALPGA